MRLTTLFSALPLSAACGAVHTPAPQAASPAAATPAAPTTTAGAAPATPAARTEKWIDLAVGDCLADPPPSDPGVVAVVIVDCAAAHTAEVYARAPVEVNAAIADVADRACATGFTQYTGRSVAAGPYTVSYLIDSHQDRTINNPRPSTVICLLQAADGKPLTGSARR